MFKIKHQASITLILCLLTGIALATTTLPKHYPSDFKVSGKITKILNQARVIELDGTAYKLHPVHNIYTKRYGSQATLYELKPGLKVGFEFTTYQGKKIVDKVWILPKDYPTTKHTH